MKEIKKNIKKYSEGFDAVDLMRTSKASPPFCTSLCSQSRACRRKGATAASGLARAGGAAVGDGVPGW